MASEPLSFSRAELTALLFKAGRGAGLPLAHAEDLGRAVGRYGDEAAFDAALRSLAAPWSAIDLQMDGTQITIKNARAIQALGHVPEALEAGAEQVTLCSLDEPALIACFLQGFDVAAQQDGAHWHFRKGQAAPLVTAKPPRADQIESLEAYAARTYVPASATSRSGAGQGADQD
ncbi:MAG: hypothetical protein AAFP28_00385 [Pseudomonadota bacterium]